MNADGDRARVRDLFRTGKPTHVDPRERQMSIRYVEVLKALDNNHRRAILTLRGLVQAGEIEWTDNGLIYRPPRQPEHHLKPWHNGYRRVEQARDG